MTSPASFAPLNEREAMIFQLGWSLAASWSQREDLLAHVGSQAYVEDRNKLVRDRLPEAPVLQADGNGSALSEDSSVADSDDIMTPGDVARIVGECRERGLDSIHAIVNAALHHAAEAGSVPSYRDLNQTAVYAIVYDDSDMPPKIVIGEQAARAMFKRVGKQWNAHLFGKLASNSSDDPHASKNLFMGRSPAGGREWSDEEIENMAHRRAWQYKKSKDPHHSDTYTFNRNTLLDFVRLDLVEAYALLTSEDAKASSPSKAVENQEAPKPVACVESWTNSSYSRNYKLNWLKDVPEGTLLYAEPPRHPSSPDGYVVHFSGPMAGPAAGHNGIVSDVCDRESALSLAGHHPQRSVRPIWMGKPEVNSPAG